MTQTNAHTYHEPVLVQEVLEGLCVREHGKYIDATTGGGGHTAAILARGGYVLGIDQDPDALAETSKRFAEEILAKKLELVQSNFCDIQSVAEKHGFSNADGVLFDLGMSSHQLDNSGRGFSFQNDEPLDMRMNPDLAVTAADLVNALGKKELALLFTKYGEAEQANVTAQAIVLARKAKPIKTSQELANVIERVSKRRGHLHPATKVFMALRIAVNDEFSVLEQALSSAANVLAEGGHLAVISFHSGEDRIVKVMFKGSAILKQLTESPIQPSDIEIQRNPRARSARLRVAQKVFKESSL